MAEQTIGSIFKTVSANTNVVQLIAPAENTNGMTLCTATMHTGPYYVALTVGTKAPKSYTDLTVPYIFSCRGTAVGSGYPGKAENLPYPLVIPAGQGLWVAAGDVAIVSVTYQPVA